VRKAIGAALMLVAGSASADEIPAEVVDAVQRLPAVTALEAVARSAPCVFDPSARHLERIPSAMSWARIPALAVFDGLPDQPPGTRAVVVRPTRELLARNTTRTLIAERPAILYDHTLTPLPPDAPRPSFIAFLVSERGTEPESCTPQGTGR